MVRYKGEYSLPAAHLLAKIFEFPLTKGFVNMSAFCSKVSIGLIRTVLLATNCLKWWYFKAICLVRGVNLGLSATLIQLRLSSQTVQKNLSLDFFTGRKDLISPMRLMNGSTSHMDIDKAMYF